ncbi:hypothetical protein [Mesoterricola sediminis]|uniref:Uncharacterized protein n=1 Tax=Mesoterricola sediminis TaxID=2927980 RepID=A0AA48GR26_9BACT|nr:hypothetical protein [Mesoterricola sediminis]BDU76029.1 hypothetical protein METESE_09870 [Mesoterricola sediminis]
MSPRRPEATRAAASAPSSHPSARAQGGTGARGPAARTQDPQAEMCLQADGWNFRLLV